jgi:hypothetical protein
MMYNVQSNTAKFFIINVNLKCKMFWRFLDRHHQLNCLLEGLMMAVQETPKHVAFLIDVNNKEFGCVSLNTVYHLYICLTS